MPRRASGKKYEDGLLRDWFEPPPWILYKVALAVLGFLEYLVDLLTPPPLKVIRQCNSFIPNAWLSLTAHLGIPDLLKDGPKSAPEIAQSLGGLREDDIYRGLRLLVNSGFYSVVRQGKGQPVLFRNNAASSVLRTDHPNSMRQIVRSWHVNDFPAFSQDAMIWHLQQKGGDDTPCAFEHVTGQEYWDFLKSHPEREALFISAMKDGDIGMAAIVQDFRWDQFDRVLDIGGATGTVIAALAEAHPKLKGILFDQPQVIEGAVKKWQQEPSLKPLQDRIKLVGGDFFKPETIPSGRDGDVYVLRVVIHDWSDDASIEILKSVRKSIGPAKARLALIEIGLIPEFGGDRTLRQGKNVMDMLMHAVVRGKERTEAQFAGLLSASGFRLTKCHPTRGIYMVIEAQPV